MLEGANIDKSRAGREQARGEVFRAAGRAKSNPRYCALTLRPRPGEPEEVVLLATKAARGSIAIFVSPRIFRIARGGDLLYIQDLIWKLPGMAERYPDLLFAQLATMYAGPLRTSKTGRCADISELFEMWGHLVDLDVLHEPGVIQEPSASAA